MKYGLSLLIIISLFLVACTPAQQAAQPTSSAEPATPNTEKSPIQDQETPKKSTGLPLWMTTELKNVADGEKFIISDFIGKPILVDSFAVWCPTCTKQQKITNKLHEEVGDDVVSISLDTDPNEDEDQVKEHIERNGFTWRYAVLPIDLTRSLIDEFGVSIVNAPRVPMILVCADGSYHQLPGGIKPVSLLKEEIANC